MRFRLATDKIKRKGLIPPLFPSDKIIITFYSDRNLGQRMEFKNPNVAKYYVSRESTNNDNKSDDTRECKDFMQKEIQKHLDNLALRGMVATQEMLSFPKVAKNVESEYKQEHKDYTWKVKADDESILIYGSREYVKDKKKINRLLTNHHKTESNQNKRLGIHTLKCYNLNKNPIRRKYGSKNHSAHLSTMARWGHCALV